MVFAIFSLVICTKEYKSKDTKPLIQQKKILKLTQRQQGYFGRSIKAERKTYVTYADINVKGPFAFVIETVPLGVLQLGEGTPPEDTLHGVGMSAQSEVHVALRKHLAPPVDGVVAHQELEALARSLQRAGEVAILRKGGLPFVLHADEGDGVSPEMDEAVVVVEQRPAHLRHHLLEAKEIIAFGLRRGPAVIGAVVVIAQHGIDAMGGVEAAQNREERFELTAAAVDDVAGKKDELGFKGINTLHHATYDAGAQGEAAQVEVAELHDAETLKPLGEARRGILHPLHL